MRIRGAGGAARKTAGPARRRTLRPGKLSSSYTGRVVRVTGPPPVPAADPAGLPPARPASSAIASGSKPGKIALALDCGITVTPDLARAQVEPGHPRHNEIVMSDLAGTAEHEREAGRAATHPASESGHAGMTTNSRPGGKILAMVIGILAAVLGVLLAAVAIGIPRLVSRRNRPEDDADSRAYLTSTGRSAEDIERGNADRISRQGSGNRP